MSLGIVTEEAREKAIRLIGIRLRDRKRKAMLSTLGLMITRFKGLVGAISIHGC